MNDQLKKRLIGAIVLVALLVIFLPMVLEQGSKENKGLGSKSIPDSSLGASDFDAKTQPLPSETGKKPGAVQPLIEPPPVFVPPREELTESLPEPAATPAKTDAKPQPKATQAKPQAEPKTVAKPAAPAQPASATGETWAIQLGTFSAKDKADALVTELKGARMAAFVMPVKVGDQTLYRVRIGPNNDRAKLEPLLKQLQTRSSTASLKPQILRHP